jgi:phosphatidylglycerol:prolipoprotein diacylglycerol transferase
MLPTFGVLAAMGLMLALGLSQYTAALAGVDPDELWDAGLFAVLAAFVLSRVLLVTANLRTFMSYPMLLLAVPSLTATGLLLTVIATLVWLHFKRIPLLPALDAWAPCATLVWAFLALGHFAEDSDPGMPAALPWGVTMPGDMVRSHPVGLYAALVAAVMSAALYAMLKRRRGGAALALIGAGVAQFLLSFVRVPGLQSVAGLDALQVVALGMIVVGCGLSMFISLPSDVRA